LRRLPGEQAPLSDEDGAAHTALLAEYRALEEEYSGRDECPKEVDAKPGALEAAMEALERRPVIFDPVEVARAGVFVTPDRKGGLSIHRGYVRPEDERRKGPWPTASIILAQKGKGQTPEDPPIRTPLQRSQARSSPGGQALGAAAGLVDDEDDSALKPLPERLVKQNAPGDVSHSLGLRVPVSAGDGPSPPSRSQNKCPA